MACSPHLFFQQLEAWGSREAQTFYKRLADMLSNRREVPYSTLMGWLRCKLSFAILRSAVMCIRGSRSSWHHPIKDVTQHSPCLLGAPAVVTEITLIYFTFPFTQSYPLVTNSYTVHVLHLYLPLKKKKSFRSRGWPRATRKLKAGSIYIRQDPVYRKSCICRGCGL